MNISLEFLGSWQNHVDANKGYRSSSVKNKEKQGKEKKGKE